MILNKKVHSEHYIHCKQLENYLKGRLQFSNGEMQFPLYRISPQSQKQGQQRPSDGSFHL